jgi:hypothetical protein
MTKTAAPDRFIFLQVPDEHIEEEIDHAMECHGATEEQAIAVVVGSMVKAMTTAVENIRRRFPAHPQLRN